MMPFAQSRHWSSRPSPTLAFTGNYEARAGPPARMDPNLIPSPTTASA